MSNKFPDYDGAFSPIEFVQLGERVQLVVDSLGHWAWRSETSGDSFSAIGYPTQIAALAAHARFIARRQGLPEGVSPERPGARYQAPERGHGEAYNYGGQDHG